MQEAFVNISGVRTKITTFGGWIEESLAPNQDIIIIIPGNPGVNSFYNKFGEALHQKLGFPVWIVGHAGHNIPENSIEPLPKESPLYLLQGQVQHKLEFILKYVPQDAKLHLIGHSIGSYMILEFIEQEYVKNKVVDTFLLFPTIEYMRETSNGKFLTTFVKPVAWLLVFLAWFFTILPEFLQNILLIGFCFVMGYPRYNIPAFKDLIKPDLLNRVFLLGFDEMKLVRERNHIAINSNLEKLHFVYGDSDDWAPIKYYNKLMCDITNVRAQLTTYKHAFVIKQSVPVAELVSQKILETK